MIVKFTNTAKKDLSKLDKSIQKQIINKLENMRLIHQQLRLKNCQDMRIYIEFDKVIIGLFLK